MADKGVMWQLLLYVRVFKHLQQEILLTTGIVFPTLCYVILTWEIHNRHLDPLTVIPFVSFATYATSYIRKVT